MFPQMATIPEYEEMQEHSSELKIVIGPGRDGM
jgi:hypothetical protein